jgi:VCBS repeat-containing protein
MGSGVEDDGLAHSVNLLANSGKAQLVSGSLTFSVNGIATGQGGTNRPTGVTLSGNQLSVNTNDASFDALAAGEQQVITANYQVSEGQGSSTAQSALLTITGVNDAPQITSTEPAMRQVCMHRCQMPTPISLPSTT